MAKPTGDPGPFPGSAYSLFAELLPRIFENAVDGICLTSTDGVIHAANPAACRIFGRTEKEICRLGRDALLNWDDPRLASALEERRRTGRCHAEITVVRPDGSILPVDVTSAVLTEPGPASPAVIFLRDVSERVRSREELTRERALLDRVFSTLDDGILVGDVRTRTLLKVNSGAERILGYPAAELEGRDTRALYPTPEEFERTGRELRAAFAAKGFFSADRELRRKDGSLAPVRVVARPVADAEGVPSIIITVLRDLTEERRAEAERSRLQTALVQAEKLEGLGVLTAGLAHDFNNLLVPILGNATMVAAALPEGEPLREPLADIAAAARQASALVAKLLAYSGRPSGARARLDLGREALGSVELLRACVPRKVALALDVPSAPMPVTGDAAQLRQLLVTLATNAGEALASSGGTVTLRAGIETCAAGHRALSLSRPPLPPGRYAWVEVADDGPGMPPEVASRAIDPFFTTKGLGRGLGLPAVSGIVRAHGGALEIETAPDAGTRVRAWLPAAPDLPAASARAASPAAVRSRVLLVDDEPLVRHAARRILERAGYEIVEAADGPAALERLRADPAAFDAVLLDLSMPRMSGEETFAALREVRKDLPVVLSSGYSSSEVSALLADPLVRFAAKPYDREQLVLALRAVGAGSGPPG